MRFRGLPGCPAAAPVPTGFAECSRPPPKGTECAQAVLRRSAHAETRRA
jgi:hypothetical protein